MGGDVEDVAAIAPGRKGERMGSGATHVFEVLRQDIIALRLAPGTVLSRAEIQERFGFSSTPVRDALLRLQEERLVEVFPQHATVVSPIDLGLARQAQFLRRSVELEVVRALALRPDRTALDRLHSILRQMTAFAGLGEQEAFAACDQAFHHTMYEAAGVAGLWQLICRQSGHIDRLRRLHLPVAGKIEHILQDHRAILEAIEAGQPDQAQLCLRDHLSQSLDFAGRLRRKYPGYFRD